MLKFENKYKVLLVDEDVVTTKLLYNMLTHLGAICEIANGKELLGILKNKGGFDILMMRVSVKDEYSQTPLINKIVSEVQLKLPIIGITSDNDTKIIRQFKQSGFNDVLLLPPSPHNLHEILETNIKRFNTISETEDNEIDDFLDVNYLANISVLPASNLMGFRKIIDFTENDTNHANNIIGMTLFSIVDDMRLMRHRIIAHKWAETAPILGSIQNALAIFSEETLKDNINALSIAFSNRKEVYHNVVELFNEFHSKLLHWAIKIYPSFNSKQFSYLLINASNTAYEAQSLSQNLADTVASKSTEQFVANSSTAQTTGKVEQSSANEVKGNNVFLGDILIIDDDETITRIIEFKLKKEGYNTKICKDGKAAVDFLTNEKFNLVITDLMMPYYNGLEIISIARNQLKLTTPIVVLSSVENEKTVVEALRIGANDFISKPFSAQELLTRVQKYIQ